MAKRLRLIFSIFLIQFSLFAAENYLPFTEAPVVVTSAPGVTIYPPGTIDMLVDPNVRITDVDSDNLIRAEIILSDILDGTIIEQLFLTERGTELITQYGLAFEVEFSPVMRVLISGPAPVAIYERILREIIYDNRRSSPTPGDRRAIYTVTDEDNNISEPVTRIIRIEEPPLEIVETEVVNLPPNGLYGIDDVIELRLAYSEPVFVSGGTPYILLNINGVEVRATYVSGSGTDELLFAYTVEEELELLDMDGIGIASTVTLDGADVLNSSGETIPLEVGEIAGNIFVDGIRPFVVNVQVPADGVYAFCAEDVMTFTLKLNEAVQIDFDNLPELQLLFDSGEAWARFDQGNVNDSTLVFTYEIQEGDQDLTGIRIGRIRLNGTTIFDIANNDFLDLEMTSANVPDTSGILIDTSEPNAPLVWGIREDTGISDEDGITNAQNLEIFGTGLANSTIVVFLDGEEIGRTDSNADGWWDLDYTDVTLEEGSYEVTAFLINELCAESPISEPYTFIIDLTPPTADLQEITVSLNEEGNVTIDGRSVDAGSSDDVSENSTLTFTVEPAEFSCDDLGENEVTVTVTDEAGNSVSETVMVTVIDDLAPTAEVENYTLYLDENGAATFSEEDIEAMMYDNCGIESIEFSLDEFGCSDVGENEVEATIRDLSGNETVATFTITVADNMGPVIANAPDSFFAGTNVDGEYTLPDFTEDLQVSDNCEVASVEQFPAVGTILEGFDTPHTITIIATDIHGNQTDITFTITLVDNSIDEVIMPEIISVPWNTQIDDLPLPSEVRVILRNGEEAIVQVTWQIDNYEAMEPGFYQNEGVIVLPGDIFNPDGLMASITIIVEDKPLPEDIELDNQSFQMDHGVSRPIGSFNTIDPSDDQHTYALADGGADNGYFRIEDGQLFWNTDEQLPGRTEFIITVSSTDRMGNIITRTFTITRVFPPLSELRIVNVFSPNGDGINDTWGVEVLGFYGNVRVMVFERSGKRVYYSHDPYERWDGNYLGEPVVSGAYYYIIEVVPTGEVHRSVLTILRD
ncbi:gliding motility-associated C-terminal domain-containing protein [Litoribacter alkaliphilus]|uniref:Gliding motility-associated C-terminal domain-containing protein n=1 Tax=Litoribacter ruber TaxID=702568 RepID=A0AAP2CHJ2_9BACT|nr:gliding motility-associated C-terminal domain-containing protein [Litoribacter alkaliphilus]MBS9524833.1 gliding motility-associated C-terminal domain-containing protein [Litoribacter alkaliphilus]